MHGGNHCRLGDAGDQALIDRGSGCDAQRMAIETSFAEKMARPQDAHDRFLASLGNDGELDLAFLDVKDRVRDVALRKNNLTRPIIGNGSSAVYSREKRFGIERDLLFASHGWRLFFAERFRCMCAAGACPGESLPPDLIRGWTLVADKDMRQCA